MTVACVDVAFTTADAREADVTIVIDVLRATSTIVQALDAGYRRVLCADGLDRARGLAGPGRVLAGERHCVRPADFDLGNSPAETIGPRGDELILATTNGAPAIVRAADLSPVVLIACLLNLDAVVEAADGDDVQLLCSGTDARPALEDVYVAGRIAERLGGRRSDSALVALAVARGYARGRDALAASADAQVLGAAGLEADIDWCARESVVASVPRLRSSGDGVAVVA
ncbi:MAG: 2-phosphosulfolactate phosphatase [Solirubrobacteraceae bacterium]|nr:2-phosphosulfolactate phosphatase [Solirubrobacteraceae bacterium]